MEINNIIIRKASIKNIDEILYIENLMSHKMFSKTSLESDLTNNMYSYFIAYKENNPVGFIGICNLIDTIDLNYIAILPDYQNQGIGKLLIKYIINHFKENNIEKILLEVRSSNKNAIKFYESLRFKKISERKNYYSDTNESAYIYEKLL